MPLGKQEDPDFKGQAHWTNEMSKGSIEELTRKPSTSKEELGGGLLGIIR
jgi:hypothetical protein